MCIYLCTYINIFLLDSTKLENYKSIIEDNKGRIKYYDAYSILYNFEYSLSLLIRVSV